MGSGRPAAPAVPGISRSGSAPMTSRLAACQRGHSTAISAARASGPGVARRCPRACRRGGRRRRRGPGARRAGWVATRRDGSVAWPAVRRCGGSRAGPATSRPAGAVDRRYSSVELPGRYSPLRGSRGRRPRPPRCARNASGRKAGGERGGKRGLSPSTAARPVDARAAGVRATARGVGRATRRPASRGGDQRDRWRCRRVTPGEDEPGGERRRRGRPRRRPGSARRRAAPHGGQGAVRSPSRSSGGRPAA